METRSSQLRTTSESYKCDDDQDPPRDDTPGTASDYISHLRRIVRRTARHGVQYLAVVLHGRVSSGKQGRNGNLEHQLSYDSRAVKCLERKYGVTLDIIGLLGEEDVLAWKFTKRERAELVAAAELAR